MLVILMSVLTFGSGLTSSFIYNNDVLCDLHLPAEGCTCRHDPDLFIDCHDLGLNRWPDFSTFHGYAIHTLDLSGNKFKMIPKHAFGNATITNLIISHNRRSFSKIHRHAFNDHQRTTLRSLDISNNHFESIPSFIRNIFSLQKLEMKGNYFDEVTGDAFIGLFNLTDLHLGRIDTLAHDVFKDVVHLKYLEISPKAIYVHNSRAIYFFGAKNTARMELLESLIIDSGVITFDDYTFFNLLLRLKHLEITRSALDDDQLDQAWMEQNDVKYLSLSRNRLRRMPEVFMYTMSQLEYLDLSHNGIRRVNKAFKDKGKLMYINLSHNNIKAIKKRSLMHLTHLQEIDLSHNKLKTIVESVFPNQFWHGSMVVRLGNNKWACSCRWWLMDQVKNQHEGHPGPFDPYEIENDIHCYDGYELDAGYLSGILLYDAPDVVSLECSQKY